MKCFLVFVLVALAAVAMAQQDSSFTRKTGKTDPERVSESGEVKRDRRGFLASSYSAPIYYGARYNVYSTGYDTHYNAPYVYYRSYPHYGYGSYYY